MMKAAFAKAGDFIFTKIARKLAFTGCWSGCHRPDDAPEELFK